MTKDYARRGSTPRSGASSRPARKTKGRKKSSNSAAGSFNAPSFSAGIILGAALVLLASFAPAIVDDSVDAIREQVEPPPGEIEFEFADMLETDTVVADPSVYPAEFPEEDPNATPTEYIIQAASLRKLQAAADLSRQLSAVGLIATWERVDLNTGTWYRVLVGPYDSQVEANRALTQLRKRNLGARLIKLS